MLLIDEAEVYEMTMNYFGVFLITFELTQKFVINASVLFY